MEINICGAAEDLHTGFDGGAIHEPFHELSFILAQLVDGNGNILIPGFYDKVRDLPKEEEELYAELEFDWDQYKQSVGLQTLKANNLKQLLVNRQNEDDALFNCRTGGVVRIFP